MPHTTMNRRSFLASMVIAPIAARSVVARPQQVKPVNEDQRDHVEVYIWHKGIQYGHGTRREDWPDFNEGARRLFQVATDFLRQLT